MKLAFYKGEGNLLNEICRVATKGPYSHNEILPYDDSDLAYTSHPAEGGTVGRPAPLILTSGHWDIYHVELTQDQADRMVKWLESRKGLPYGFLELFSFGLPVITIKDSNAYYCTEYCVEAMQSIDLPQVRGVVAAKSDPNGLARHLGMLPTVTKEKF